MIKMHQWKDYKLKTNGKKKSRVRPREQTLKKEGRQKIAQGPWTKEKVSVTTYDAMLACTEKFIHATTMQMQFPVQGIEPQETLMLLSN